MKSLLRLSLVALGLLICAFAASPASATCGVANGTCYMIAAGNYNNTTTVWSASSGGAACSCSPAATDGVVLDSLSGSGTLTINGTYTATFLDAKGGHSGSGTGFSGTLALGSNTFSLVGVTGGGTGLILGLPSTMTLTGTNGINFTDAATETVTIDIGTALPAITLNLGSAGTSGAGPTVFQLAGAGISNSGNSTTSVLTLTSGTLDDSTNNLTVYTGSFSSSNSNTRVWNCGTGTWNFTLATGSLTTFTTSTGLTVSCASATFNIANSSPTGRRVFSFHNPGGATSWGTINISGSATKLYDVALLSTGTQPATIANLNLTPPIAVDFTSNVTYTITNAPSWLGTVSLPIMLEGNTGSTATTLKFGAGGAGNGTLTAVGVWNVNFTAGASTTYGGWDFYGTSNQTFTAPASGGGHIIGG